MYTVADRREKSSAGAPPLCQPAIYGVACTRYKIQYYTDASWIIKP